VARVCTVCTHPDRAAIDEALAANRGSFRGVARQHGLSPDAVERHAKAHLSETVALATRAAEATRADDLLGLLREAVRDAQRLRWKAEADRDYRCAVAAGKTLSDVVEKLATVAERLGRNPEGTPATLSDFIAKVAREARAGDPDGLLRVEWVNDWRGSGPGASSAQASRDSSADVEEEAQPIPARLVS
jgi:hypothetical protein